MNFFEALKNKGLGEFVELFKAKGCTTFESLGKAGDAKTALDTIKSVIGDKGPGWVNKVFALWEDATKPVVVEEPAPPCGLTTALTEAGYADLAKLFTKQGYLELTDLGLPANDEKTALEAIKGVLKDKPGAVGPILNLWKKARQAKPPPSLSSTVAKDLVNVGLEALAIALTERHYKEWSDFGRDPTKIREQIKEVSPTSSNADVERAFGLWQAAQPAARPLLEIPKLPAGTTVDLSPPTLTISDATFKLPDQLATKKGDKDYTKAFQLTDPEWLVIAKRTRMLCGLNVNSVYQEPERVDKVTTKSRALAKQLAFLWKVPSSDDYLDSIPVSEVGSRLWYTRALSNLVDSQVMEGKVEIGTPFVSVAAEASRKEKHASGQLTKTVHANGWWRYQYAEILLDECTELSKNFIGRIDEALKKPSRQEQIEALEGIFKDFGHVYPRSVKLGGHAVYDHTEEAKSKTEEDKVESSMKAAITAKYGPAAVNVGGGVGTGHTGKVEDETQFKLERFRCVGGDPTLASVPGEWAPKTADPNLWQVISRGDLAPLIDRLDDGTSDGKERLRRVREVWDQHLKELWGGRDWPEGYVMPDFRGAPFSMWTTVGTEWGLTPNSVPNQLATLSPNNLKSDAPRHGLSWELVYSGRTTEGKNRDGKLTGLPIYFIVEWQTPEVKQSRLIERNRAIAKRKSIIEATGLTPTGELPVLRVMLAAMNKTGTKDSEAGCLEWPEDWKALAASAETSPAAWILEPVDPESGASQYVIRNRLTGRFIGLPAPTAKSVSLDSVPNTPPATGWPPVWECLITFRNEPTG